MKITELDLQSEGKRYKCGNRIFKVKDGDLVDIESNAYLRDENISIAYLLNLDFEEIKETKNPYERVDIDESYCFVNTLGEVDYIKELNDYIDNKQFNSLNYFNNRNYAEYVAFKETLMRKMDRFAWEHNAKVINWDMTIAKHYIVFNYYDKVAEVMVAYGAQSNDIYFTSQEIAEKALEKFEDDLIKLYTWKFDL